MRIAVLTPSYDQSDSPFKAHDPRCDPSRWAPQHDWVHIEIDKRTSGRQIRDLAASGIDVFVNLCDGAFDEDRAGLDAVMALERYGCAYTGADPRFYEPTRAAMKRVCASFDIDTADFAFCKTAQDLDRLRLKFPLIVKHPSSYGSIGMGKDARVADPQALFEVGSRMIATYGEALIEEFIEGREFTVLVAENPDGSEPISFGAVECRFPEGETFKHFDLKWKDFEGLHWAPVTDPELDDRLQEAARRMFVGCMGRSYGRCDLRMSPEGRIVMLEINPNCGIFYPEGHYGSADEILQFDARGHAFFVDLILRSALERRRRLIRAYRIEKTERGFGMFAARDLQAGELVDRHEERGQPMVSTGYAQRFGPREKDWFDRYAWPLGPDLHATWSEDPDDWRPIDHSCDPNTWLEGLDLVARRPIRDGEPITMDYATFCGDTMQAFQCGCGSALCRGTVKGSDHRLASLRARYKGHTSAWVASRTVDPG